MSTWTAPITWSVGQTVTKAQMDAEIRDHATFLKGAFTVISNGTEADTSDTMNLWIKRAAASSVAYSAGVTADANARFTVAANGDMGWGPGTTAVDITLKRDVLGALRLDGRLNIYQSVASTAFTTTQAGDANLRFAMLPTGEMRWGDGTSAYDTDLFRSAANIIGTNDSIELTTTGAGSLFIRGGLIEMDERTIPSAPGANRARIYVVDNGSGKTSLRVIFNTGAAQTIATEP